MACFIPRSRVTQLVQVAALAMVLCGLSVCVYHVDAIVVTVGPGEIFTVREIVLPHRSSTFQFHLDDSHSAIDVRLEDDKGNELFKWEQVTDGHASIDAEDKARMVVAHFDNKAARTVEKNVNFYFNEHANYMAASVEQVDPIEKRVSTLAVMTQQLQTIQIRMRTQQKEHRHTVDNASRNIVLWSAFQIAALIIMSGFQLFILKRFLERKTFV